MLSVILYGRNDDHGHNYHKRLAIGLNCMAEILTDHTDEIVFVDYNSSDDQPTIVEAIQDTLTEKAKWRVKILRVRARHHEGFKTPLYLLDPVARNVAIRRSNPHNPWILSTNPDMIFLTEEGSLSDVVSKLSDGFYALPRFELPENLWEIVLDRMNPQANLQFLKNHKLQLNTIVRMPGFLQYDNPGDFQLILRKDVFQIGGFNESMTLKWHVDSNLAKRMSLLRPGQQSLENQLMGFHCNHTLKQSHQHGKAHLENRWNVFVNHPNLRAELDQKKWGLEGEEIEEIRLKSNHIHIEALESILIDKGSRKEIMFDMSTYNNYTYCSERVFPFLADHLCHISPTTPIVYVGHNLKMIHLLKKYMDIRGFVSGFNLETAVGDGKLTQSFDPELLKAKDPFTNRECESLALNDSESKPCITFPSRTAVSRFNNALYIFDFGFDESLSIANGKEKIREVLQTFFSLMSILDKKSRIKVIGINVNHTDIKSAFAMHLSMQTSSLITTIAYGYIKKRSIPKNRKFVFLMHYLVVRYFFNQADNLRNFITRARLLKYIKKISV